VDRRSPLVSLIVFLLVAGVLARPLRVVTFTVLRAPLVVAQHVIGTLLLLPQVSVLAHDQAQLQTELVARQLEVIRLRETLRQLTNTQTLSQTAQHLGLSLPPHAVVVSVLARPLAATDHTMILDRGIQQGLVLDGIVLDAQGVVGRVLQVFPRTSVAMLITDPNSRIACLVERSREHGLLMGTGERFAQLTYLDMDADVVVGDRVVTSGLGGIFPKGWPLGIVVSVTRDERQARLRVSVRPAARLSQVEHLLYVPPSNPLVVEEALAGPADSRLAVAKKSGAPRR